MAKLTLNKSALQKERNALDLYKRLLPSLDLKRMQLTGELNRARDRLARDQAALDQEKAQTVDRLPMLANRDVNLAGIVRVESVEVGEENVVGVRLPILKRVAFDVREYSLVATPPWVDVLVDQLQKVAELQAKASIGAERVRRLERAVRRITQRVNLFDKILIPTAKSNIQ
ncbi:MAG: V-type ATP synthase subunit D, partial [Planctomycetes bacterium]|nr:V-type ATP synthase subunit D [Planctomycetota bacterium]